MKKTILSTLILSSLASGTAFAELGEEGISGEVSLNAGFASETSNFNTDGEANNTSRNEADAESQVLVAPLGNVAYTFGSDLDKQVFLGTAREDIAVGNFVLELGYRQELESGMVVGVSFLPTVMAGETWSDPYALNTKRETTDITGNAYRLSLSDIAGSNFSLDLAYGTQTVDNEKSGSTVPAEQSALARDAKTIYMKGEYKYGLDATSALIPSATFVSHSADGSAMSYNAYGVELTYFKAYQRHQVGLTAGYTNRSYDGSNPVFDKTRSDDKYSLFAAYEYDQAFGLENWSFISLAGYGKSASNIEFYNESEYLISVGMNYRF